MKQLKYNWQEFSWRYEGLENDATGKKGFTWTNTIEPSFSTDSYRDDWSNKEKWRQHKILWSKASINLDTG